MIALILGGLVLLVLLLATVTAIRHPHLRRMAWGNFIRHRTVTLLTILGAMIGTALITSTLLMQSSMMSSKERAFDEQFGRIYAEVPAIGQTLLTGQGYFSQKEVEAIADLQGSKDYRLLDGTLPTVGFQTTLMKMDGSGRPLVISPKAYVHGFDPQAGRTFDAKALHGVPTDLGREEIVLSTRVADVLEAGAGDQVVLYDHQKQKVALKVRAVVPEQGLTGYRGTEKALSTGIVSLATARELAGVPEGRFSQILLARQQFPLPSMTRVNLLMGSGWAERSVQAEVELDLEHNLKFIPVFNIASINAVVIGIVLILNMFKMMAEERRQELGVLRAIGLTRRDLARMLRMEGVCYALASSVVGILAGIGISYLLLLGMRKAMSAVLEYEKGVTMKYVFSVDPSTLLIGFAIGVLLVFLCICAVSRKAAKLQIVEAMHETDGAREAAKGTRHRSITRTGLALGSGVLTLGFLLVTITDTFQEWVNGLDAFPLVIFALGFVMIGLTVLLLLITSMNVITSALQWLLQPIRRLTGVLRLSLRYPEVKRSRTALLVSMFALVFFLTSFSGVFSTSMTQYFSRFDARVALGGFDLSAEAQGRKMTSAELQQLLQTSEHVQGDAIAEAASVWQIGGQDHVLNGIDEAFVRGTDIRLVVRDPKYASDEAAWEAVTSDPDVVIVSEHFHEDLQVGQEFPVGNGPYKKIISIAGYGTEMYGYTASYGAWIKQSEIPRLTQDPRTVNSQLLLKIKADPKASGHQKEIAKGIEKALTLESVYPLINPVETYIIGTSFITVFFSLFEGFSALATLIGIVGLMVVMLRVIRERRQQIGMLRAIGVRPDTIYWSILIEGALIGILGITLGLCVGCYTGLMMIGAFAADGGGVPGGINVVLPVARLALYFGGALVVTLFCAAIPARQAMRLSPAEATRYTG